MRMDPDEGILARAGLKLAGVGREPNQEGGFWGGGSGRKWFGMLGKEVFSGFF
jgi:hypothetical protein